MIDAATTLTMVNTEVPITTERQARALGQVVRDLGAEAAAEVLEHVAATGIVTASRITEAAQQRNPITEEMRQAADDVMRGPTPEELAAAAEREAERAARRRAEADAENARQRNTEWHLAMATIRGTQHPVQLAILKSAYEPSTYHYDSAELHRMADILHDIANRWDEA
jgi:hypothetical protein